MSGWKGKVPSRVTRRVSSSGLREHAWTHKFIRSPPRPCPCAQRLLPWSRLHVFSLRRPRALAPLLSKEGLGEVCKVAHTLSRPIGATPARQTHSSTPSQTPTLRRSFSVDLPSLGSLPGRSGARSGALPLRNRLCRTKSTLGILGRVGRSVRNHSPQASRCASKASSFTGPDASSPHSSGYAGSSRIRSAVVNLVPAGIVILTHCPRGPPPTPDNTAARLPAGVCDGLRTRARQVAGNA